MSDGTETREALETRKRELYAAVRLLEEDRADGSIGEDAYQAARQRHEAEAAGIMQRLDAIPAVPAAPAPPRSRLWLLPAGLTVAVALALFLVAAVHSRGSGQTITGDVPTVAPTPRSQLDIALQAARAHPGSAAAQIALGNAYLNSGQTAQADRSYRRAMRLAPNQPQAATLHAMMLAGSGSRSQALALLRTVERRHPRYARAWLLSGLVLSRTPGATERAVADWRRFLRLQPHGAVSADVRKWIAGATKKGK